MNSLQSYEEVIQGSIKGIYTRGSLLVRGNENGFDHYFHFHFQQTAIVQFHFPLKRLKECLILCRSCQNLASFFIGNGPETSFLSSLFKGGGGEVGGKMISVVQPCSPLLVLSFNAKFNYLFNAILNMQKMPCLLVLIMCVYKPLFYHFKSVVNYLS